MNPDNFLESLNQDLLVKLSDEARKDIITMGDFNANVIAPKLCKYAKGLIHATRIRDGTLKDSYWSHICK